MSTHQRLQVTSDLVDLLIEMRRSPPTTAALTVAKQCLLDWIGVTLAARKEPLVRILAEEFSTDQPDVGVHLFGFQHRAPLETAALINGSAGHALDYDDVIAVMGHPTAPIAPVVFGLGEHLGVSGNAILEAFLVGFEAECRVANLLGHSHYEAGWHGTATFGTFGAAAAAGQLLDLSKEQLLHAFGLAGTQAAGLKSVFGTMSKPLHAGKAAQNGLLAARLARRGFTSDTDILGSTQGFSRTQSRTISHEKAFEDRDDHWVVDVLFKYHAACYLTHNTIEAAAALRTQHRFLAEDIDSVSVKVQSVHMNVCNIESPKTGLECKFSLRMTCALSLIGEDTFDETVFSDSTAARPDLIELQRRISVEPSSTDLTSTVEVRLTDGRLVSHSANVAVPLTDLQAQQSRLERKFRTLGMSSLNDEAMGGIIDCCVNLDNEKDISILLLYCANAIVQRK